MDTLRLVLIIIGVLILAAIYLYSKRRRGPGNHDSIDTTDSEVYEFDDPPVSQPSTATRKTRQPDPDNLSEQLSQLDGMISQDHTAPVPDAQQAAQNVRAARTSTRGPDTGMGETIKPAGNTASGSQPPVESEPAAKPQTVAQPNPRHESPQQDDISSVDGFPQIIVLNISARHGGRFQGADILNAVHAAGMEFGNMGIFHRFTLAGGRRCPIFSVANMLEPGSFDFEDMTAFSTTGLTLFMQLPAPIDSLIVYEDMLTTAQNFANSLNGDVWDERRNILTLQAIDHTREQLREFNYKLMVARKRAELER